MHIKGKDIPLEREACCGCMIQHYPLPKDCDLLDWLIVNRTMDMEKTGWSMQLHKHKDFQEFWFVLRGGGKIIDGDEEYDVEPGDLCIMDRDRCHKIIGDITVICLTALHNVYGQTVGRKMQFEACDAPYRENPEGIPKVGEYSEMNVATSE